MIPERLLKSGISGRDPALRAVLEIPTWNRLEAGSSKLEAWLTGSESVFSLEPQASCLKRISASAEGRILFFQQPAKLIFVG
jgi:hypothetical protein